MAGGDLIAEGKAIVKERGERGPDATGGEDWGDTARVAKIASCSVEEEGDEEGGDLSPDNEWDEAPATSLEVLGG